MAPSRTLAPLRTAAAGVAVAGLLTAATGFVPSTYAATPSPR